jgi:hypothetical protein
MKELDVTHPRARGRMLHFHVAGGLIGLLALVAFFPAHAGRGNALVPAHDEGGIDRPNILIIMTDDQRAHGTLSVMPRTRAWFTDQGTTFTNAWVTTPLCCPSRSSIFTGR